MTAEEIAKRHNAEVRAAKPGVGHNSQRFAKDQLRSFVERIEKLEEEKKAIADDIRDVYTEAASSGFDKGALRAIVKLRKEDPEKRKQREAILETYMLALGLLD